MKKLAAALVLSALAVSPALAQSFSTGYGTGNIAPDPKHPGQQFAYRPGEQRSPNEGGGYGSYAQAPGSHQMHHWSTDEH